MRWRRDRQRKAHNRPRQWAGRILRLPWWRETGDSGCLSRLGWPGTVADSQPPHRTCRSAKKDEGIRRLIDPSRGTPCGPRPRLSYPHRIAPCPTLRAECLLHDGPRRGSIPCLVHHEQHRVGPPAPSDPNRIAPCPTLSASCPGPRCVRGVPFPARRQRPLSRSTMGRGAGSVRVPSVRSPDGERLNISPRWSSVVLFPALHSHLKHQLRPFPRLHDGPRRGSRPLLPSSGPQSSDRSSRNSTQTAVFMLNASA